MSRDPRFFRDLLDNLYDGVYFVDRNRVITYWNRGAERTSGFSADEVTGSSCRDNILCHVDDQGRLLRDGFLAVAERFRGVIEQSACPTEGSSCG